MFKCCGVVFVAECVDWVAFCFRGPPWGFCGLGKNFWGGGGDKRCLEVVCGSLLTIIF
jgi:hypothetical protein